MAISITRSSHLHEDRATNTSHAKEDLADSPRICQAFRRIFNLVGMPCKNTRALFIFSEDNVIRKYARMIIEWGYPFVLSKT